MLGLLRHPDDGADPVEPAPGLAQLDELLDSFRTLGLSSISRVGGVPAPLPAAVDLVAYRVVQESLTNVRKHAGRAAAEVRLEQRPTALVITVTNDGGGVPARVPGGSSGHRSGEQRFRLIGMRDGSTASAANCGPRRPPTAASSSPRRCRSPMTTHVLIADDQALLRAGFRALIDSADDLEVVGEAATGREAMELVRAGGVDVVLMDVRMPEMDGLAATRAITADPDAGGGQGPDPHHFRARRLRLPGAALRRERVPRQGRRADELLDAIRLVDRGDSLLSPVATRALITRFLTGRNVRPAPHRNACGC